MTCDVHNELVTFHKLVTVVQFYMFWDMGGRVVLDGWWYVDVTKNNPITKREIVPENCWLLAIFRSSTQSLSF